MRTPTEKQIRASRFNGLRSRGPVTPEGKARSSRNGVKHGLCATTTDLELPDSARFHELLAAYLHRLRPANEAERQRIHEMVAARWRQGRAWAVETELYNQAIRSQPNDQHRTQLAAVFENLAGQRDIFLVDRYETTLSRKHHRLLNQLLASRTRIYEANPAPENRAQNPKRPHPSDTIGRD